MMFSFFKIKTLFWPLSEGLLTNERPESLEREEHLSGIEVL